jgi:hypothetical protein
MGLATGGLGFALAAGKGVAGDVKNKKRKKAAKKAIAAEAQQTAIANANPTSAIEQPAAQPPVDVTSQYPVYPDPNYGYNPQGGYPSSPQQEIQQPVVESVNTEAQELIQVQAPAAKKGSMLLPLVIAGAAVGYFVLNK